MTVQTIGQADVVRMIQAAAAAIRRNESQLSALDAATGDGDHGTAMVRAVDAAEKVIEASPGAPLPELLTAIGWEVMCAAGGATGPLFGSLFTGMGESASGRGDLDAAAVAAMFEAGLASVREQTQAQYKDASIQDIMKLTNQLRHSGKGHHPVVTPMPSPSATPAPTLVSTSVTTPEVPAV